LEAASSVFAESSFFKSTISQIARKAGVADGTIYLYFKNKDDILYQIFDYKMEYIFQKFRKAVDEVEGAGEKLRNLIRCHLSEFQKDRNMTILFQSEVRHLRSNELHLKDISKMYLDLVSEIIEQGQVEGCMRKDLYLSLGKRFVMGAVDEVINTWVISGGKYDLSSMADPLVDLFISGIGVKK